MSRWVETTPPIRAEGCQCERIFFGLGTVLTSQDAPKGGLPGAACKCGLTWMAYGGKRIWHRAH